MERNSKFNVGKNKDARTFDGIVFDSSVEMKYYRDVILPKYQSGEITHYERQKKYILQPAYIYKSKKVLPIEYKADFYIVYKNGEEEVIDVKGCPDAVAKIKKKILCYILPNINYIWVVYSKIDGGWRTYEEVQSARAKRKKAKKNIKESKDERK